MEWETEVNDRDTAPAQVEAPNTAERRFSQSMVVSGTRCLLTYLVLPFLLPVLGVADSVGPAISLPIGLVAIVFNGLSIRRFWGPTTAEVAGEHGKLLVIGLLCYLTVRDLVELAG